MWDLNGSGYSSTTTTEEVQHYFDVDRGYQQDEAAALPEEFRVCDAEGCLQDIAGSNNEENLGVIDNQVANEPQTKLVEPEDAILIIAENFHELKSSVPDAKTRHLWGLAKDCFRQTESAKQYAEDLINTGDYPLEIVDNDQFPECEEPDTDFNAAVKYCSLRSIFPDADAGWIWGVAKDHKDTNEDVFNTFIIHLQETGDYPKFILNELPAKVKIEVKRHHLTKSAQEILNNIDARYIEEQLNTDTALGYNEQGVSTVILNCIGNAQCPSKSEEYYRRITQEAIQQYSSNFNIEKFLQRFPEPVKYFENPTNPVGPKYRADVFKYLRVVAPHLSVEQIRRIQKRDLYLFQCHRSIFGCSESVPMSTLEYKLTDECARFINELTFIRFYKEILPTAAVYASLQDTGNSVAIEESLYDLDTISCELCEEPVPLRKVMICTEAHMFCVDCARGWVNERLGSGHVFVSCLKECTGTMSDDVLFRVLPAGMLDKVIKRRQDHEVGLAQVDGIVNCLWCDFSYVPRNEDMTLVCLNPECGERWCKKCRELGHFPYPCEDTPEEKEKRVYIEERMTKAAFKQCPGCTATIEKIDGCDYVTCRCGVSICYRCGLRAGHSAHPNCNPPVTFNRQVEGERAKAAADRLYPGIKLNFDPTRLV